MTYLEVALLIMAVPVVYVGWLLYNFLRDLGSLNLDSFGDDDEV